MFIKGSAEKRKRQSDKRRLGNRSAKSVVKTELKKVLSAVEQKEKEKAAAAFQSFVKLIDTAAQKGIYTRETAARKKSRLHHKINAL